MGHVPVLLPDLFDDLAGHEVYIAGGPGFVSACAKACRVLGAAAGRIHTEEFFADPQPWSAPHRAKGALMTEPASTIYTKLGDDGSTARLFGGRLSKDDALVDACGDIDETVSALGVAREALREADDMSALVLQVQRQSFVVAADLMANPRARRRLEDGVSRVVPQTTEEVERTIDQLLLMHPLRPVFVVPDAIRPSAAMDLARAVCRRAERQIVRARSTGATVSADVIGFINRLGDLLYVLARQAAGHPTNPPATLDPSAVSSLSQAPG